jgi:predicted phage terminase large subunit-like protein
MPNAEKWDYKRTGLISDEEINNIRQRMTASLFAANYELRHIAAEDVIFTDPVQNGDPVMVEQGDCHVDAAYGGEDYTAFTIFKKRGDKYYLLGKLWHKHVDDCMDEICRLREQYNCGKIFCEDNGDKGYLAKDLRKRGERAVTYHESMNKFVKITSYLKNAWIDVIFVTGTDEEYINQICDYNENAEHDDAPDSAASAVRRVWSKKESTYIPIW